METRMGCEIRSFLLSPIFFFSSKFCWRWGEVALCLCGAFLAQWSWYFLAILFFYFFSSFLSFSVFPFSLATYSLLTDLALLGWRITFDEYYNQQTHNILNSVVEGLYQVLLFFVILPFSSSSSLLLSTSFLHLYFLPSLFSYVLIHPQDSKRKFVWSEISFFHRWWEDSSEQQRQQLLKCVSFFSSRFFSLSLLSSLLLFFLYFLQQNCRGDRWATPTQRQMGYTHKHTRTHARTYLAHLAQIEL